ncbi:MAG: DUF488 domain-containing protein [Sedimentisphaerales bacterium]|nr:DUF488 domain-containing protein [Sedimentisphaerales bacterium]
MKVFTIGFSGKSARVFFDALQDAAVRRLIDVRLYNTSQLAGYAKKADLGYFLEAIVGASYEHLPILSPTRELLDGYKKGVIGWDEYEKCFNDLMVQRGIEGVLSAENVEGACFLCSESRPEHCHRRLVVEYLAKHWEGVEVQHL